MTSKVRITVNRAERWWIDEARKDPYYFIWYVTGHEPAEHHKHWLGNMLHPTRRRINMIAARESAKTTIAIYTLLWLMSTQPTLTFGILAVSSGIAEARLAVIKDAIRDNARYKNVFPWIHIDQRKSVTLKEFNIWSDKDGMSYQGWRTGIILSQSHLDKNPSIFALGVGGRNIGKRISGVLLLDDVVDENYLSSELQTKMMRYINQTLEPTITEIGRIWNIGTRWMVDDIYERLSKNKMWHTITIPAILYDAEGDPHSYWPDFWPLERIQIKKDTMDDDILFRIMYLCDPSAITAALFTYANLTRDLPEILPAFSHIYMSTDFASSLATYADWNILYAVGVDEAKNVFLLDGVRYKVEMQDSVEQIINFYDMVNFIYGKVDGLLVEKGILDSVIGSLLRTSHRPDVVAQPITLVGDKMERAKQPSIWSLRGKLYINQKLSFIEQLRSEFLNFPVHRYDDTLDALSLVFQHIHFGAVQAKVLRIIPVKRTRAGFLR